IYDRAYVLEQITHDYGAEKITADGFSAFHFIQKIQISPSRLFDASLYLENLKTGEHKVPAKTENPASHFLASWPAGVNFSKYFDIPFYDINNPHVANSGSNPLDHYFRTPDNERTDVNPMFHSGYYLLSYKPEGTDPLVHFLDQGHAALNLPNPYARQELLSDGFVTPQNLLNYIKVRS
ncbi:MAG: hypothetical protein JKY31_03485, partial [Rhodobacteraceae bacterium]|nr:hypothetical protein [Paracoccaceae bacterium]